MQYSKQSHQVAASLLPQMSVGGEYAAFLLLIIIIVGPTVV